MSYEVDLWGRVRRTVAPARNEAQATAADLETARLSLQAELAIDYFELRAADAQQQLLDETVKAFEAALRLTTNRFQGGAAPKSDVAQAQTQLDTTRVQATDIAVQRAQFEHAIAVLIGKPPAAFSLPRRPLDHRPPDIPVGVPSQLLERRPDIAAAERRVAEANEQIGIARAAYYPTVMLNASVGFEGSHLRQFPERAEPAWVGRGVDHPDDLRRRAPARHLGRGARRLRRDGGGLPADHADRVPAGGGQPGRTPDPGPGGPGAAAGGGVGPASRSSCSRTATGAGWTTTSR